MKKIILLLNIVLCCLTYAQNANPEISTELPKVIPPSPSVSALMKFEEIPVSNYTGVPDISIPIINIPTNSKDINLDIALKYHPAGVAADERASDVGLGWSLHAGGTISRTVRGLPDELLITPSGNQTNLSGNAYGKIGIYQNNVPLNNSNNYYYFIKNIANQYQNWYKPYPSQNDQDKGNEFLWSIVNQGKYDTEHDVWQFNFMDFSGKFYIKKNDNNVLEVAPLSDYRIKIINNYDSSFKPTGFTVYDEKGYKYIFDVIEITRNFGGVRTTTYTVNGTGGEYSTNDQLYSDREFNSSFHLSKIFDNNNQLLINFNYNTSELIEGFTNTSVTKTEYPNIAGLSQYYDMFNKCGDLPPIETINNSSVLIKVKKLQSIEVVNQGKIEFNFLQGRSDTNINNQSQTSYLNSISIKDAGNNPIKKIGLEYDYSQTLHSRMFLKKINLFKKDNSLDGNYEFDYYNNDSQGNIVSKDAWGYFNLVKACLTITLDSKKSSPDFSTHELLRKIKYPTGGSAIFDFETNRYSYIGNQEVTDFSENDHFNQLEQYLNLTFTNQNNTQIIPVANYDRKVTIYPSTVEVSAPIPQTEP